MKTASQYLRLGHAHLFTRPPDYLAARRAFCGATRAAPRWGEPYYWVGLTLELQGRLREAMGAYEHAIRLRAGARPLIALGFAQERLGDHEGAIESLQDGLALGSPYAEAEARLLLASCYESTGRTDEAIQQWRIVASLRDVFPSDGKPMEEAKGHLTRYGRAYSEHAYLDAASAALVKSGWRGHRTERRVRPLSVSSGK